MKTLRFNIDNIQLAIEYDYHYNNNLELGIKILNIYGDKCEGWAGYEITPEVMQMIIEECMLNSQN